jgi:hypothetical protein
MIQGHRSVFNMTVKAYNNWSIGVDEYWVRNKKPAEPVMYLFQSSITPLLHYSKDHRNLVGLSTICENLLRSHPFRVLFLFGGSKRAIGMGARV